MLVATLAAVAAMAAAPALETVDPAAPYPEGPVQAGASVYYAEMGADRVMVWDGRSNRPVWARKGCGPTSVADPGKGSELVVLCHLEAAVAVIDRKGGTLAIIDKDDDGHFFMTPNASIADGRGGVYLSSSGLFSPSAPAQGGVLYLGPDRSLRRLAEGIHYSNGVALAPGGKRLYVSEHLSRRILAYDVADDRTLSNTRVFLSLDDIEARDPAWGWEVGPDGLAIDPDGNLAIAEYGAGHVLIVGPDAKLRATIAVPQPYVTAPVYIDGGRRIFITAPASLYDPQEPGGVYVAANPLYRTN